MGALKTDTICDLSEKAWSNKGEWDSLLSECYEHAMPNRNPYFATGDGKPTKSPGSKDRTSKRVFDSTLLNSASRLANRLQGDLFPQGHHWAQLRVGPFVGAAQKDRARQELHAIQQVLFTAIELSNFDMAIAEWLLELVVAGTAIMLVQEGDNSNPVVYQCVPQSHVALREGVFGFIDLVSRKHFMRHSLIEQTWKDATAVKKPSDANDDSDDPEMNLIEVTYHDHKDEVWRYCVIVVHGTGSEQQKQKIVDREYVVSPWSIARWMKAAGEAQGRSLVMSALPDARVLSAVKRYLLQQAALAIGGVFLVRNDGVVNANTVSIYPGARIPVRSTGGGNAGASVAPLNVGGDLQLAQLVIDDLVSSIRRIMMDEGMPDIRDGVRTAQEFMIRLQELQQTLGPPFARVLKEGIVPMLEATLATLGSMKIIPMPQSGKIKLNSGEVAVNFTSPLVQQQSLREIQTLTQAVGITREISGPESAMLSFKVEEVGAFVGQKMGVVPSLMRTKNEAQNLQTMAGQMAAMQMSANQNAPQVGGQPGVLPQQQAA